MIQIWGFKLWKVSSFFVILIHACFDHMDFALEDIYIGRKAFDVYENVEVINIELTL